MKNEKILFKTKHTLYYTITGLFTFYCLPIIGFIPFIELPLSEIDIYIVLYELFLFFLQLFLNYFKSSEIIYTENNLYIYKDLFFKNVLVIPVEKIQGYELSEQYSHKFTSYKFKIKIENKIIEYRFLELNKETIEKIGTMINLDAERRVLNPSARIKKGQFINDKSASLKKYKKISLSTLPCIFLCVLILLSILLSIINQFNT